MAEKLVIQSNIRYTVKFLRDDVSPYDGKFGRSYGFYVSAQWSDPDADGMKMLHACTLYLQEKEAQQIADLGAGKGAVFTILRKEAPGESGGRTYSWIFNRQTAAEKEGFDVVDFTTKARVDRLGASAAPATPPASAPPKGFLKKSLVDALAYHRTLYGHCLEAAQRIWETHLQGNPAPTGAVNSTASTLYIQLLKEGVDVGLEQEGGIKKAPTATEDTQEDPSELPF